MSPESLSHPLTGPPAQLSRQTSTTHDQTPRSRDHHHRRGHGATLTASSRLAPVDGNVSAMGMPPSASSTSTLRSTDSWIEVASQPSSSSLSSANNDEVVTTGLRVQSPAIQPQLRTPHLPHSPSEAARRRRSLLSQPTRLYMQERLYMSERAGTSSQDEYEESESESDRVLTSSNEALPQRPPGLHRAPSATSADEEEADDESATALGVGQPDVFTPQPNAFSHPPVNQATRSESYFSARPPPRAPSQRHSYPARQSHNPLNAYTTANQADHDAALRASLSTLLSCAAAARGLPKPNSPPQRPQQPTGQIQPGTLRMVPESVVMGTHKRSSSSSDEKRKRKSRSRSASRERAKALKKEKLSMSFDESQVSPTLMTWVVSAGVLVLVSALSFSAGYTMGREAGQLEAGIMSGRESASCGQDAARGLRRLRWGSAANLAVGVAS